MLTVEKRKVKLLWRQNTNDFKMHFHVRKDFNFC